MSNQKKSEVKFKRLFFDIETSYNVVSSWRVGHKINISHDNIIKERAIICICWKWHGEKTVHSLRWDKGCDKKMLIEFMKVLNSADEICGQNSDRFDIKWIRTRCLLHKIPMFPSYQSIDTLKLARSGFNFNSNRLDYLGKFFGFGGKTETGGFKLWKSIIEDNDKKSMELMIKYCIGDVLLLEKVYDKLNLYSLAKTHVGVALGKDKCTCPNCGSDKKQSRGKLTTVSGTVKSRFSCNNCGKYYYLPLKKVNLLKQ